MPRVLRRHYACPTAASASPLPLVRSPRPVSSWTATQSIQYEAVHVLTKGDGRVGAGASADASTGASAGAGAGTGRRPSGTVNDE